MFTWSFSKLEVYPTHSGLTNVIADVQYRLAYTNGSTTPLGAYYYGTVEFADPDPNNFIEFDDMTESDFITMVETTLGAQLTTIQSNLQAQYASPKMEMGMPWMPVEQDLIEDIGIEEPTI